MSFFFLNDFIARRTGSVLTLDIVKELYFLQIIIIFQLLSITLQFCSFLLIQTYLSFSNPILPCIHYVKKIVHFSFHFIISIIHSINYVLSPVYVKKIQGWKKCAMNTNFTR